MRSHKKRWLLAVIAGVSALLVALASVAVSAVIRTSGLTCTWQDGAIERLNALVPDGATDITAISHDCAEQMLPIVTFVHAGDSVAVVDETLSNASANGWTLKPNQNPTECYQQPVDDTATYLSVEQSRNDRYMLSATRDSYGACKS